MAVRQRKPRTAAEATRTDSARASGELRRAQTPTSPEDILDGCLLYNQTQPPFWKRKRFHFIIGMTVGLLLAAYGASTTPTAQTHLNELQTYLALQLADLDIGGMLPAGDRVDELFGNVTSYFSPAPSQAEVPFMPALMAKETMDLKPHFPVIIVPGIISSGLESWGTAERSRKYFRKRMWGTTTMFRSVLLDKESWTQHLQLDPTTGLDPPDIRVRVAQGLDAADYFVTGYWVWAKIIENLAAIGYDSNNMYLASYDWRLSFYNLEVRDKYFTKLKAIIETYKQAEGRKVVIVAHSMGSVVFSYFMRWAQDPHGGNCGDQWTEEHIESFVNVAGPMVGVPKALTAMLSGETRDTMALGSFGAYLLEKFFSRRERAHLLRTWGGGSSMLPKGGDVIWGDHIYGAPDDEENSHDSVKKSDKDSFSTMIAFTGQKVIPVENLTFPVDLHEDKVHLKPKSDVSHNHTAKSALELLYQTASIEYNNMLKRNYSFGIETSLKQLEENNDDYTKWANPLESQLPFAPSMKIFCLYGTGLPTERSYYYAKAVQSPAWDNSSCQDTSCEDGDAPVGQNDADAVNDDTGSPLHSVLYIDGSVNDPARNVETGVRFSDGDGTVPLLSLGYMCAPSGGWRKHADLYNPGHSPVMIREYKHEEPESKLNVRGGSKAGDHVDILGNWEMTLDILKIVSNHGHNLTERIISNVEQYAQKIQLPL